MDKIIMTKDELRNLGEQFYEALDNAFLSYGYITVRKEGIIPRSTMYGCIVSVNSGDVTDEELGDVEDTIDRVCNDWEEKTDYGWDENVRNFWVAISIDEIAPDPVDEDECPECGATLEDNGEGIMCCPYCNPMDEMDEDEERDEEEGICPDCGEELEEGEDGMMFCPNCKDDDKEFDPDSAEEFAEREDGEFFPDGNDDEEREKLCPECGEPLDEYEECPNCGWTEDYDGDGELCPDCEKLIIEDDGLKMCPHCGWDERDDWDQDQWNEYYANR